MACVVLLVFPEDSGFSLLASDAFLFELTFLLFVFLNRHLLTA